MSKAFASQAEESDKAVVSSFFSCIGVQDSFKVRNAIAVDVGHLHVREVVADGELVVLTEGAVAITRRARLMSGK